MSAKTDSIMVINQSTVLTDAQVQAVLGALQAQITEDFAPIWNATANLKFGSANQQITKETWPVYVLDHTDHPGALGYHVDTLGRVSGRIFAADDLQCNASWTVDLSHEILEMLADPKTSALITLPDGRQCLREVCDAVQSDAIGYLKQNVLVSNFVLPAYFFEGQGSKYDFCGKLGAPAPALMPGGYLGVRDPKSGQWSQITAHLEDGSTSLRSRRQGRTEFAARQMQVKN